jgi:hypothetical protein
MSVWNSRGKGLGHPGPQAVSGRGLRQAAKAGCGWLGLAAAVLLAGLAGCRSPAPPQAVDLRQPGWHVREGQVIWRHSAQLPELAGELLVATHADGRWLVQFSKTPFLLVSAQGDATQWQLNYAARRRVFQGQWLPPPKYAWLAFYRALEGHRLAPEWQVSHDGKGNWRLENRRTGETIAGYLSS